MKTVSIKTFGLLFVIMLFSGPARSLELGQILVESHLNQPLKASITIDNIESDSLDDVKISVADNDSYQLIGLSKPYNLPKLNFTITAGQDGKHIVQITSRQAIKNPILEILIKVSEGQGNLLRLYTLLIDPVVAGLNIEKTVDAKPKTNEIVEKPGVERPVSKVPLVDEVKSDPAINTEQETILVKDSNISLISQNSRLHEKYSVYQIMRAFYLGNGKAFLNGNISKVKSGSRLIVPAEETVAEVTRQQAVNFVYSVSKDFPAVKNTPQKQVSAVGTIPEIAPQRLDIKDIQVGIKQLDNDSQAAPKLSISQDIRNDLDTWRTMTDEFKSLSSVVQTQNQVLKIHSGAIRKLSSDLDLNNGNLAQFALRLQALELTRPLEVVSQDGVEVSGQNSLVQNALQNQNRVISLQGERINTFTDLLAKNSDKISGLNDRVGIIERELQIVSQQASSAQRELLAAPTELVTVTKSVDDPGIVESTFYSPRMWLIIVAAVILILVIREIIWRRRIAGPDSPLPQQNQMKPRHNGIAGQDVKGVDVNYVNQKTSTTAQDSNPEIKSAGKGPIGIASVPGKKKSKLMNISDIYTELDIYIVYELFDEAQTLLDAAREVHTNDSGLDLKELEILAHTKNFEPFFSMFEEKKEFLSSRFPIDWGKLSKMKEKLSAEFQYSKTQKI